MAFPCYMVSCAFLLLVAFPSQIPAEISYEVFEKVKAVNALGDSYGVVVPEASLLEVFLSGPFRPSQGIFAIEISDRTFHVGSISNRPVILVMTGKGMLNTAQITQLLLKLFRIRAVIHYGKAGSANPEEMHLGDISVPSQVAHSGIWYWQENGVLGDGYVNNIAKLKIQDYTITPKVTSNSLGSVYLQPGEPQVGEAKFSFNADKDLYNRADKIAKSVTLNPCVARSLRCLSKKPKVKRGVGMGCSADIFINNVAYGDFLHRNLNASTVDTESAAVGWVSYTEKTPFIVMKSVTNLAGRHPPKPGDLGVINSVWPEHLREVVNAYFKELPNPADDNCNLPSHIGCAVQ